MSLMTSLLTHALCHVIRRYEVKWLPLTSSLLLESSTR